MAKEVAGLIKLQIKGGAANPAPPVGPALGAKGVNIMEFCKQFNARTQDQAGKIVPVIITVYADKSFDFVVKTPPVAVQLKEMSKAQKGSAEPNRVKVQPVIFVAQSNERVRPLLSLPVQDEKQPYPNLYQHSEDLNYNTSHNTQLFPILLFENLLQGNEKYMHLIQTNTMQQ